MSQIEYMERIEQRSIRYYVSIDFYKRSYSESREKTNREQYN